MTIAVSDDAGTLDPCFDLVIVGAGFAGLYMLHTARVLGMSAVVIEVAPDVGGTWYWNRYPGARCDVKSLDYSFSFDETIEQEWNWTETFAAQPEILAYINFVADRLDLRRDIRFDRRVTSMHFDESNAKWDVVTDDGARLCGRFCVMATGCLSVPKEPDIPGLASFEGEVYSTSYWPEEKIGLQGKKIGLIGTGSSGIQVGPMLAQQAEKLYVFQRTPNFTIPARNAPLDPAFLANEKSHYRERREAARRHPAGHLRPLTTAKVMEMAPEERREAFDAAWRSGGQDIFGAFGDLLTDEAGNAEITAMIHEKIDSLVDDPAVAEKLKPLDYPFAGRRVCLDTDYYPMFNRPNVELVDLRGEPIEIIGTHCVKTSKRAIELDMIVLAAGFDAITGSLLAIDIRGKGGLTIQEKWHDGPVSYLGLAIADFPNLFTITGPGSPSVLTNMVCSIEQHVEWLRDLFVHLAEKGFDVIEADKEAEDHWASHVYDLANRLPIIMQSNSWYLGANVPGKPRVFMPYAGGLDVYRDQCDTVAQEGYQGFHFYAEQTRSDPVRDISAEAGD